jgi:hypothetical protein
MEICEGKPETQPRTKRNYIREKGKLFRSDFTAIDFDFIEIRATFEHRAALGDVEKCRTLAGG